MPNKIQHKRNTTSGATPAANQLDAGELAINTADGRLFAKNTAGTVINLPVTSIAGQTIAPRQVVGGDDGAASGALSSVLGGKGNTASGLRASVGGGAYNTAIGATSSVSGGQSNLANARFATVSGGYRNTSAAGAVSAGLNNTASGGASVVGGGGIAGTFTVTIASPAVFTMANHGLAVNDTVRFETTGALPTGLVANTTYHVISAGLTTNAFRVSTSQGGAAVNTSGSQSGTHTLWSLTARNIASGNGSMVGGGVKNTASGAQSNVIGGSGNTASGLSSTVTGGRNNIASADASFVCGGVNNVVSGSGSVVNGGSSNTITSDNSSVSGGSGNTVTNSFSTIFGGYSCIASGTISTVAGGFTNTANGAGSFVAGGTSNTGSGSRGAVIGGIYNVASSTNSAVLGGENNSAGGLTSIVCGGTYNTASASYSSVNGGARNTATSLMGAASGLRALADRYGIVARASGHFAATGDAQNIRATLRNTTTDATGTALLLNGGVGGNERLTIPAGKAMFGIAQVSGVINGGSKGAHYVRKFAIKNVGGTTSLIGTVSTVGTDVEDDAAYAVEITADDTNDALRITVTGKAAETIRWVALVDATEIAWG